MEDFEILQIIKKLVIKPFLNDLLLVLSFDCDIETDYNSNKSNLLIIGKNGASIKLLNTVSKPESIHYAFICKDDDNIQFNKYELNHDINENNDTLYIYANDNNTIEILEDKRHEENKKENIVIDIREENDVNNNQNVIIKDNILIRILRYIKNMSIKLLIYLKNLYYKMVNKLSKKQKMDESISRIEMDTVI